MKSLNSSKLTSFALPFLILLFLGLGFYRLGYKSLHLGETFSLRDAQNMTEFNQARPLYFYILRAWRELPIGDSEFVLRIPAVIFGLGAIIAIYFFTKTFFNQETAFWASFLLCLSSSHIRASQQVRFYSLITLLTILEMYVFLWFYREFKWYKLLLYWLLVCLAVLTSPIMLMLNLVQALFLIINARKNLKTLFYFLASNILAGIAGTPWWLFVQKQLNRFESGWISVANIPTLFNWEKFLEVLGKIVFSDVQKKFGPLTDLVGAIMVIISVLCLIIVFREKKFSEPLFLIVLWIFFPILALLISSTMGIKLFHEKALYYVLPAYYLALGYLLFRVNLIGKMVILSGALILSGFSLGYYYSSDRFHSSSWREIVQQIQEITTDSQDPIVVYPGYKANPLWYYKPIQEVRAFPELPEKSPKLLQQACKAELLPDKNYWLMIDIGDEGKIIYQFLRSQGRISEEYSLERNTRFLKISALKEKKD